MKDPKRFLAWIRDLFRVNQIRLALDRANAELEELRSDAADLRRALEWQLSEARVAETVVSCYRLEHRRLWEVVDRAIVPFFEEFQSAPDRKRRLQAYLKAGFALAEMLPEPIDEELEREQAWRAEEWL